MDIFQYIYQAFFLVLFLSQLKEITPQINDNFISEILEEGNYELIDVTDYHNKNLVVSTSKNIYAGIPPNKITQTEANLINSSAVITINENYLLACCLQDSFLSKINLSDGSFTSLLNYTSVTPSIEAPIKSCSLSNIDNTIFIGYSKIVTTGVQKNVSNIIFRIGITNKDDKSNGPSIATSVGIKYFQFPKNTTFTPSSRHISCEPLKLENNDNDYRLVCLHEGIYTYNSKLENIVYATSINSDFDGFNTNMTECQIRYAYNDLGFRIFKENETFTRCMTSNALVEIYLKKENSKINANNPKKLPTILYNLDAEIDLIYYNNKFRFSVKKKSFMGKDNVYTFQINHNYDTNYFLLYDYQDTSIKKILGYYNQTVNKIICLYQTNNNIKYFTFDYKIDIFTFGNYNKILQIKSFQKMEYNINELTTNQNIDNLGQLTVESIKYITRDRGNYTVCYGINLTESLIINNTVVQNPTLNEWKTYNLSFIDIVENQYTRIFHLNNLLIEIQTCAFSCTICLDYFSTCTNCENSNYAKLIDQDNVCFKKTDKVEGYIYNSNENSQKFLKCYDSCKYCTASVSSSSQSNHNCVACKSGYLYSYVHLGNCYKYNNLEITREKQVSNDLYISSTCSAYRISTTGECVNQCPTTNTYYTYHYNEQILNYETVYDNVPKYLFNNVCYEQCPINSESNNANKCICTQAFYKEADNDEHFVCLSDVNCTNEYPYQNKDTKECYESLEKCTYFFRDDCFDNCPNGKVTLSSQSEDIKNYIKNILSLDDTLKNKICVCDKNNSVWINNTIENNNYQECLTSCPDGYVPEEISNHCILKVNIPTTIITTFPDLIETTMPVTPTTELPIIETTSLPIIETTNLHIEETTVNPIKEITSIPIEETTSLPIKDTTSLPMKETTNLPMKETSNLSMKETTNLPLKGTTNLLIKETTYIPLRETTNLPYEESSSNHNEQIIKTSITSTTTRKESTIFLITETTKEINPNSSKEIMQNSIDPNPEPHPHINDQPNCPAIYNNTCYEECPQGTCLSQNDPRLRTCVNIRPNTQVFNGICFDNFESLTKNIKSLSDNNETIESVSGVIIRGYSVSSDNYKESIEDDAKYSVVNLGDCEYKLREYYNLTNDTELFILGIDSPNRDICASINTYNYGVYLSDGTLLDHNTVCKESKISISSPITNEELVKLNEAVYFSEMGYDIYNEESNFYNDYCTPASIDGNDIILSDRKKDFYPSNVSLCNDSCSYTQVDLNSKRFTCQCDLAYNFSEKKINTEEIKEEEDVSYFEYLLSLINYKIIVCYKLFLDYKSYYYNAGFYIAVGTLVICLILMIVFIKWGIKKINIDILENIPNKLKLLNSLKEKAKIEKLKIRGEEAMKLKRPSIKENPPKKNNKNDNKKNLKEEINNKNVNNKNKRKSMQFERDIIPKRKSKIKSKTTRTRRNSKKLNTNKVIKMAKQNQSHIVNKKLIIDNNDYITINNPSSGELIQNSKIIDDYIIYNESHQETIEYKEFNTIPYFQAIKSDDRSYAQIFLSMIYSEIKIIRIFYYKNNFEHMSIILSEYAFELCLDLTFNCLLYTEDVISEKYNNDGNIRFFTTLSLSFMSNIISSIICSIISKLSDYVFFFEVIIKDVTDKDKYFLNMLKFKKFICIKLSFFFFIQNLINLGMCYYLMIFCTVYHKTQGSIMINYLTGIAESMAISFGLALITSLMRYFSIKCRWKSIYYTSKYFFENF